MKRLILNTILASAAVSVAFAAPAMADKKRSDRSGGYSYKYSNTINTYGDSRNKYGSSWSLRDRQFDRQTEAGPFDHGFFFDSGIEPRGGNSPYMN